MRNNIAILLTGILLSTMAVNAEAQSATTTASKLYVGLEGGVSLLSNDATITTTTSSTSTISWGDVAKTGGNVQAALGYMFKPCFALEAEIAYANNAQGNSASSIVTSTDNFQSIALSLNGEYVFGTANENTKLHPFVGLGLASYLPRGALTDFSDDKNAAYQVIAGLSYQISDKIDVTCDYHYFHLYHMDIDLPVGGIYGDTTSYHLPDENLINVGIKYHIAT